MESQFKDMSKEELTRELERQKDLLEEYHEERDMFLGQSGHHISSTGLVKKYAGLISETESAIAELEKLIKARD